MTQVLVETPSIHPAMVVAIRPFVESQEAAFQQQQGNVLDAASIEERRMASELAHLASQHHASEYNRMKFGPLGAPAMYIPLSIQLPAHVRDLKLRQSYNSKRKAWWPAKAAEHSATVHSSAPPLRSAGPHQSSTSSSEQNNTQYPSRIYSTEHESVAACNKTVPSLNCPPAVDLQRELSVAMSSSLSFIHMPQPFSSQQQRANLTFHAKTSETHPINISPIVPTELLPLITAHLEPSPNASRLFDLPQCLHLYYLVVQMHQPQRPETMRSFPFMHIPNGNIHQLPMNGAGPPPPDQLYFPPHGTPEPKFVPLEKSDAANPDFQEGPSSNDSVRFGNGHGHGHELGCLNGNTSSDVEVDRPRSAPPSLVSRGMPTPASSLLTSMNMNININMTPPPLSEFVHAMSTEIFGKESEKGVGMQNSGWSGAPSLASSPLFPALGNILLSSCPGKKVRLTGPVKGRGAICRDLGHDLRRIKSLGVGCIICCLDDDELDFLGASWPEYSENAHSLGLDVLRIPIPEGLTPLSPALLDQQLSYIIHSYTLKGIPVLVHCRGGVGRAGLIACCWMLKLGLCGWLQNTPQTQTQTSDDHTPTSPEYTDEGGYHQQQPKVRRDTIMLVEKVIAVVRRRRSVKAIETYEQVRFLVEFVEWMRRVEGGNTMA